LSGVGDIEGRWNELSMWSPLVVSNIALRKVERYVLKVGENMRDV